LNRAGGARDAVKSPVRQAKLPDRGDSIFAHSHVGMWENLWEALGSQATLWPKLQSGPAISRLSKAFVCFALSSVATNTRLLRPFALCVQFWSFLTSNTFLYMEPVLGPMARVEVVWQAAPQPAENGN
jgi:hypothetical protein